MMRHFLHDREVIVDLLAVIFLSIPKGEGGRLYVIFVLSSSFAKKSRYSKHVVRPHSAPSPNAPRSNMRNEALLADSVCRLTLHPSSH